MANWSLDCFSHPVCVLGLGVDASNTLSKCPLPGWCTYPEFWWVLVLPFTCSCLLQRIALSWVENEWPIDNGVQRPAPSPPVVTTLWLDLYPEASACWIQPSLGLTWDPILVWLFPCPRQLPSSTTGFSWEISLSKAGVANLPAPSQVLFVSNLRWPSSPVMRLGVCVFV